MTIEKRKHVRIDMINPSEVRMYNDSAPAGEGKGRTVNISRGGVLLETPFPIENGQNLALVITLEKEFVYISGRVVHTRREKEGYKTGVEFLSVDDRGLILLDKSIAMFMKDRMKTGG
jgi:c-di-GMP-binding flagellar brake protein YcgR